MNELSSNKNAWYYHTIPWLMLTILLATITSGVMMIVISVSDPDDIVVDDYYKQGLGINRDKARNERARKLGIKPVFTIRKGSITILVKGTPPGQTKPVRLHLQHPTRKRLDKIITLPCTGKICQGTLSLPEGAKYYYSIEPGSSNWRISGKLRVSKGTISVSSD
jgi:hypothetical protein